MYCVFAYYNVCFMDNIENLRKSRSLTVSICKCLSIVIFHKYGVHPPRTAQIWILFYFIFFPHKKYELLFVANLQLQLTCYSFVIGPVFFITHVFFQKLWAIMSWCSSMQFDSPHYFSLFFWQWDPSSFQIWIKPSKTKRHVLQWAWLSRGLKAQAAHSTMRIRELSPHGE